MKWWLLIFIPLGFAPGVAFGQSFSPDDLVALSSCNLKYADLFLKKKGFMPDPGQVDYRTMTVSYIQNEIKTNEENSRDDSTVTRSIDICNKDGIKCFTWRTTSEEEFISGKAQLAAKGFVYDYDVSLYQDTSLLFQKGNITVETMREVTGSDMVYCFILKKKEYPDPKSIRYADDLLHFNSNEYLVGFFGAGNIRQDLYYFSENDLRKCTVLFPNSNRQAVFVWEDQKNLRNLSCIIISDILPTVDGKHYEGALLGNNQWVLKNGIYCGMSVKELLKLNAADFEIFGKRSEFANMIKPEKNGNIDFRESGITFNCPGCDYNNLFDTSLIKAKDIAGENLPVTVAYINIFPEKLK